MKLWHCVPLALLLSQSTAFAKNYGMAGCGLGSLVIKSDDYLQIFAATLNGTGVQTVGITIGTSNCTPAAKAAILEKQEHFVMTNLESLRRDMIKGDGEYLQSYAEVLGCQTESYSNFAAAAKAQEATIFRAPGALAVLEATKDALRKDSQLQNACVNLI